MTIKEAINEIIKLHDTYSEVRYDDKSYPVTDLIDMYHKWHSKSATLFSRYISSDDTDLIKFKSKDDGNAYVLASLFSELETPFQLLLDKLRIGPYYKIEKLIEEGESIVNKIKYVDVPYNIIRTYDEYKIPSEAIYQTWKSNCLRLIEFYFKNCNALEDFKQALQNFEKEYYSPNYMYNMIGILKSLKELPIEILNSKIESSNAINPITVSVVQNQTQNQNMVISFFLESIKDEIPGKQLKDLKEIIKNEPDSEKAKFKILEQVKSFGIDVLSNIVSNLLTNPKIWGCL